MMHYLPLIISAFVGVLIGLLIGASGTSLLLLAGFAAIGHFWASVKPGKSESLYWYSLVALVAFIVLNTLGMGLSRFIIIAPLFIMAGHAVSRIASKILKRTA